MHLISKLKNDLQLRKDNHLYRSRKVLESAQSVEPVINGKKVLSFCSNDYLGLANHPAVVKSFKAAADQYGVGSGASHLVSGNSKEHHLLEEELADFMGTERVLVFSAGYMANIGVVTALCDRHSEIYEDKLNHASLIDAALLSRAKRFRYPHLDITNLERRLAESSNDNKMIVSDGVFSMDGDLAPLKKLVELSALNNACLMIDDAHGIGVLGEHGKGTVDFLGFNSLQVPIIVGTLGKAFGTAGAFVAGSEDLIETLIQKSRSYIYSTALPATLAAATRKSLHFLRDEDWRREKLQSLIMQFRTGATEIGLSLLDSKTPIQPVIVGSSEQALKLSAKLLEKNIMISAIRPPTVAVDSARLRITFSATHTIEHVNKLLSALNEVKKI